MSTGTSASAHFSEQMKYYDQEQKIWESYWNTMNLKWRDYQEEQDKIPDDVKEKIKEATKLHNELHNINREFRKIHITNDYEDTYYKGLGQMTDLIIDASNKQNEIMKLSNEIEQEMNPQSGGKKYKKSKTRRKLKQKRRKSHGKTKNKRRNSRKN